MVSVPLKLSVLYVSVISDTEGCFERGLVNDFGAYWLSRKESDVVEGTQSLKPDCIVLDGGLSRPLVRSIPPIRLVAGQTRRKDF